MHCHRDGTRHRSRRPFWREDALQVAMSLVKSGGSEREAADFVSDVALTFEALSGEVRLAGSRSSVSGKGIPPAPLHRP